MMKSRMKKSFNNQWPIVLVNGISSAGKTTIVQELLALQPHLFVLRIDDWFPAQIAAKAQSLGWQQGDSGAWEYITQQLTRTTGKHYFDIELRKEIFGTAYSFFEQAKEYSQSKPVVIDTVLEFEEEYVGFFDFFKHENFKKVLVYCPLPLMVERAASRSLMPDQSHQHSIFKSLQQFYAMYKIHDSVHDVALDTCRAEEMQELLNAVTHALIEHNTNESWHKKVIDFKHAFSAQFGLHTYGQMVIAPKHSYDLIINSGTQTPLLLAQRIAPLLAL